MVARSVAVYRMSIWRMGLGVRLLLLVIASLPVLPFLLATEMHLSRTSANATLIAMLIGTAVFVPAHEAMHGLIFWLYTRRVTFGFKPWTGLGPVFYAASAGSRFSRCQYQLACLAPQLLTVLLALTGALPVPDAVAIALAYAATLNLGGGVIDIFVAARLSRFPGGAVVEDSEDGMEVYCMDNGKTSRPANA
jgi:hypothetical protein